ncbi:MAG TPA: sigma-70 family RNA polymerase sigma factor [Candidatus Saccharimonadales bacterium]
MQNDTQEALIARALGGDSEAYAEIVDRYKNAVYYHCFAIVRDEDVAEDVAQETFINAYYKLKQYNSHYSLATWLFKISTNKCLTYLRDKRKVLHLEEATVESIVSREPSPHTKAMHAELHDAVQRLRPNYRAVISLYYWHGQDYVSIAEILDAPINSVRVWLKRAKEELKKELV